MNQYVYNKLLEDKVWPLLQKDATCHTTQLNLGFLMSKLGDRVISNKTELPWQPNSPDLNPLDFFLRDHSMNQVYKTKVNDLKSILNNFARNNGSEMIYKLYKFARARFA